MNEAAPQGLSVPLLLAAYRKGVFPMVHEDGELYWHDPDPRAVFPLTTIRPNARLRTFIRSHGYSCTIDQCFDEVIRACADRTETWISEGMIDDYRALHRAGYAHSVETWCAGELIGGIYGVSIGGAFFGESMFSRRTNASKAAFHHLVRHLQDRGTLLFDTQYLNDHTRSLGAIEIPRARFRTLLGQALDRPPLFP